MNKLLVTICWDAGNKAVRIEPRAFSCSHLELAAERAGIFTFDGAGYFYNPDTRVLVSIMGYISNIYEMRDRYHIGGQDDVEIVEGMYSATVEEGPMSFLGGLDGPFFILLYDGRQEKVHLAQSEFGCPLPIYYTDTPGGIVISTSMKLLLQKAGIQRMFNRSSVKDFMSYSEIIPNEDTLVQGVKKLVTQRNVVIDIVSRRTHYSFSTRSEVALTEEEAEARLIDSIGDSVKGLARHLKQSDYTLTLTGGWDSNLMLSFLNNQCTGTIDAVTINGGGNTNEVPAVEHVLKCYPQNKIKYSTHRMTTSVFAALPDIVWILEGYMIQTGMLLRYALGGLIRELGGKSVFLGSGADPVLNSAMGPGGDRVYEPYVDASWLRAVIEAKRTIRNFCKRGLVGDVYFSLRKETDEGWMRRKSLRAGFRERYNTQIEYNMKMHELMLNSFGVQGLYPFVNKNTVSCAKPLRPWNNEKALYKEKVREYLGPQISSVLKKSQSVVDTEDLFEINGHWLEKMVPGRFIETILTARQIGRIRRNPARYHDTLLRVLYLFLFEKLILSGEYDAKFNDARMNDTLESVWAQRERTAVLAGNT
jgi:asparagine synthetase B (glutamine-hydrolysing)